MKVALFGRTGFVGGYIADILQQRGIPFIGISRSKTSPDTIAVDYMNPPSLDNIPGDVTTAIICSSKLPQKVYEASDIREFINSNVIGLINILEWTKRRKVSRLVYCSTLSMMPKKDHEPELVDIQSHYPYKISKAAAEHLLIGFCRANGMDHVVLRIASVYGPGMKADVIYTMAQVAKSGDTFTLNDGSAHADFVHVDDVAAAAVESLSVQPGNLIINATSGDPMKLTDLWRMIKEIVGNRQASVDIKGDTGVISPVYSAAAFKGLINRPMVDLHTGIRDLVKTYL